MPEALVQGTHNTEAGHRRRLMEYRLAEAGGEVNLRLLEETGVGGFAHAEGSLRQDSSSAGSKASSSCGNMVSGESSRLS
ncbi:unnamed protein product [Protopolystoma xenopodis]|uniref:Uncharacterized protein n=1 Tax=Protopolystoma xenopodis TaxID=117903 RepID=A0A448WUI5_9PLAT|nr:unnamed protein product [Protopolystoma xenopodis]